MTLENFFTESELKDGLTTPDRVNELVTVLQKEKDSLANHSGQWLIVANTIAATENNNCLELFVQLDGLFFIDKWLKDAQKVKNDDGDEVSEGLIITLLKALLRLKIDIDNVSEIGKTVQNLVTYSSIAVSEKAKQLCDNWMLIQDNNVAPQDDKNPEAFGSEMVETETKNHEPLDHVDESTDDDGNLLVNVTKSKSEEILEMSTVNADVGNTLESSVKSDVLSVEDVAVADNNESPKTSFTSESDTQAGNANGGVQSKENLENGSQGFKLSTNNDNQDMEVDHGMINPLDIARQVANEDEQDVDLRERSGSNSDSKSGQEIISQSQSQLVKEAEPQPEPVKESEGLVSQISEVAQESEPDTGRVFPGLDLNEEVFSEEFDNPVNPVNPVTSAISVISASPTAFPAQLPASHKNSKQRFDFLDFDLNVAEDGDEGKMVILPGLHSGEGSSVANPTKPEMIQLLDLNSIGDENAFNQNGWQSPYISSSSSSSSKLCILRKNFDLNLTDQPVFPNSEDSVSIFSSKVDAKKNEYVPNLDFNYGNPNPLFYGSSSHATHMPTPTPMPMPGSYIGDSRRFSFISPSSSVAPPQHNFDLNNGGLRHFFPQSANEEASSSSSVLGKRREPDSGWEFFPVSKHLQPPWM